MTDSPIYAAFLGTWMLIPDSCDYQQGEPPSAGRYRIEERDGELGFRIEWTDAAGAEHEVSFSGTPDGEPRPFAGGDLADALSIEAASQRELNTAAYFRGAQRMVAQRQLDDTRMAMRVTQLVRFPDGSSLANLAVYRRLIED